LIAGVSSGSKLIGHAKLRTVIKDYNTYKNAYNTFYLTYDVLPGDMSAADALAFFAVVNKDALYCAKTEEDGVLIANSEGPMAFWHMMLAGLIYGSYDGEYEVTEVSGVNVGSSSYSDTAAFNFLTLGENCNMLGWGSDSIYEISGKNILLFGEIGPDGSSNGGFVNYAALKPLNAYNVDNKLDDGVPNSGIVLADHANDVGFSEQCTSDTQSARYYTSSDGTLSYMATNDYAACRMMFIMDF
jgi:hypothetical protein